ncbi:MULTISPECIES: ribonuclease III [unclassified Hyphomicrobium]|jgi:ribonuclease-3|uniref:ribonuclease III n=1 Tax=unclassified Hyphomicrobium TaxID=2619925 RepID=UPI000213D812|nr:MULTISPECIES: ribonuclease III [unclassified Hyphomicrobium]CCB64409.1 ribonuclease III [Hyphomicrobium sp. MC1]
MLRPRKFKELETKLGYKFKDPGLLERALTHASVRGGKVARSDNERLEFIGDRVLGLAIAEALNKQYPEANEGELARRYNRLVRGEACAKVARNIDLGVHLILSESEADSGGRNKTTILADAAEALLGAVFIDGGFDKARAVVTKLWQDQSEPVPEVTVDAKSALQEWAQGQGLALPRYTVVARNGPDHAPRFTAEVLIAGRAPAQGEGASKRIAEQAAASALLTREGVGARVGDV